VVKFPCELGYDRTAIMAATKIKNNLFFNIVLKGFIHMVRTISYFVNA